MREPDLPHGLHAWSQPSLYGLTIRGFATPDRGKPLVHFLHGNGLCGLTYWPMLTHLQADFDLLITDVQGHGDSDSGDRFLGWNRNAEICTRVLKHHLSQTREARDVYGVAHSLGGALTTLMAAEHPGLFTRLVLLDPVYFPRGMLTAMAGLRWAGLLDHLSPLSRQARRRRQHWPSRNAAEHALRGRGIFRDWDDTALQAFVRYAMTDTDDDGVALKCPAWLEAKIFATYPRGLWRALAGLQTPTTLIMASDTFPFAAASAERAQRLNPMISREVVSGGHCFMQERPHETAQWINSRLLKSAHSLPAAVSSESTSTTDKGL